jgi:tryptophan-rich sensory protein
MSRQTLSRLLLALAILLAALAAATLVPFSASTISDLGYYTLCPFAPWSTLALLLLAGVSSIVRRYLEAQPA